MGKPKKNLPLVSVCTPTFNRRPFLSTIINCFLNQTYPRNRIEWIIVDDGTDKVEDVFIAANIPQIKYFRVDKKMTLGAKRNLTHSKCTGSIIVYMDDDDYYPPDRISHAVDTLLKNPTALCAGASEIYIFFKHINKMYQAGPYGPNHATAGTFAFRKELLTKTKYNEMASLAEEREFLQQYTIPFVQLDPLKTILVFSHIHNTYDKKKLLDNPHSMFKESNKTVELFIKHSYEANIKKFFLNDIENLLEDYKCGDPIMKPDVIKQMKELEAERALMTGDNNGSSGQIIMQRTGEEPKTLNQQEIVKIIQDQQSELKTLQEKNDGRERKIQMLESLVEKITKELKLSHKKDENKTKEKEQQVNMIQSKMFPEVEIPALIVPLE